MEALLSHTNVLWWLAAGASLYHCYKQQPFLDLLRIVFNDRRHTHTHTASIHSHEIRSKRFSYLEHTPSQAKPQSPKLKLRAEAEAEAEKLINLPHAAKRVEGSDSGSQVDYLPLPFCWDSSHQFCPLYTSMSSIHSIRCGSQRVTRFTVCNLWAHCNLPSL